MDFFSKAIDQAKQLSQKAADAAAVAIEKGQEHAKPLLDDALAKAQDLQKKVADEAPHVGETLQHVADHAKQAADSAVSAVNDAIRAKGQNPPPPPGPTTPP